jgi:hypothetical protein
MNGLPNVYEKSHIFAAGASNIPAIEFDQRFRNISVIVQPLNLVNPPAVLGDSLVNETTAVAASATTGTVTLKASPPKSFHKYDVPNGVIAVNNPHFISTDIPVERLYVELSALTGCTHVAVTIVGHIN